MRETLHPDDIGGLLSGAMSGMYREEVPPYPILIDLVNRANKATVAADPKTGACAQR